MSNIYETGLDKNPANYSALSPLSYIKSTAQIYPNKTAVVHGKLRRTWGETYARCCRLAHALNNNGIGVGDTVAVMLPNTPPMVESQFGVAMAGAVLNSLNTRLNAETIAFMLNHGEAKAVIVDPEFADVIKEAVAIAQTESARDMLVIDAEDDEYEGEKKHIGSVTYEEFIAEGDPNFAWELPADEWQAMCLNYTSGTTGNPKGVVYSHRGSALNALSNVLEWDMPRHPVYLWTLPMFHCNGWCFPWTIAARAGINVCLRKVEAGAIFDAIREHGVTHYCGAPIVHGMLINAPDEMKQGLPKGVKGQIAGAAPPAAILEGMEKMGFEITHVYGLTEVYGPAALCVKQDEWQNENISEQARLNARQGVAYVLEEGMTVLDPETMEEVPHDGETIGEIMFKGNITMRGYLKNDTATQTAFADGWFHSGDLAVIEPDGYVKIKDRSKDIIISGGENISSIEIEDVLYRHPSVIAAAVVAQPDPKWGESPCAFIELKPNAETTKDDILTFCRDHLAGFKMPKEVIFGEVPKTSTGKIQKFALRERVASKAAIDV